LAGYKNYLLFQNCFWSNPLQYPQSNIRVIMDEVLKLVQANGGAKQLMARYIEMDPDDAGYVSEKTFRLV